MPILAYHPPKSVTHGHGPRARNTRNAWDATQLFLHEHTISEVSSTLKLCIWAAEWNEQSIVESTLTEAARAFGPPITISGIFQNWELPAERLADALEFALADDQRPKQPSGPTSLYVAYSFAWRNFKNPPPDQRRENFARGSKLGVHVGARRLFLQPTFLFEEPDQFPEFVTSLRVLESAMPFTPKDDYYYRLEPRKSGRGEKLAKLGKSWKDSF